MKVGRHFDIRKIVRRINLNNLIIPAESTGCRSRVCHRISRAHSVGGKNNIALARFKGSCQLEDADRLSVGCCDICYRLYRLVALFIADAVGNGNVALVSGECDHAVFHGGDCFIAGNPLLCNTLAEIEIGAGKLFRCGVGNAENRFGFSVNGNSAFFQSCIRLGLNKLIDIVLDRRIAPACSEVAVAADVRAVACAVLGGKMSVNGAEIAIGTAKVRLIIKVHMGRVDKKIFAGFFVNDIKVAVSVINRIVNDAVVIGNNYKIAVFIGSDFAADECQSVVVRSAGSVRHN